MAKTLAKSQARPIGVFAMVQQIPGIWCFFWGEFLKSVAILKGKTCLEKKIGGQNPPNCNWWSSPGKNHWLIHLYIFLYTYIYNMFFWCRKYQHSMYQLLGVNLMATQSLAGSEKELFQLISESKFQVEIWCSSLFFVPRSVTVWCLWWLELVPTIWLVFVDRHHLKIPPGGVFCSIIEKISTISSAPKTAMAMPIFISVVPIKSLVHKTKQCQVMEVGHGDDSDGDKAHPLFERPQAWNCCTTCQMPTSRHRTRVEGGVEGLVARGIWSWPRWVVV